MRSLPMLRSLVRRITVATLAGVPLAAGCGAVENDIPARADGGADGGTAGDAQPPKDDGSTPADASTDVRIDANGFVDTVCTGQQYESLSGISPAGGAVDYVELRDQWDYAPVDGGPPTIQVIAKQGTPCATAANKSTCTATLNSTYSTVGWEEPSPGLKPASHRYLVFTRGDSVNVVDTLDELEQFLAPIDTAKDAALLVSERGYRFICPSSNAKASGGGFELIAQSGHTCGEGTHLDEHRIAVSSTGDISILETKLIEEGDPGCAIGRRPSGLQAGPRRAGGASEDEVGRFFAAAARLEAASVPAFEQLARDLAWHGAPDDLVSEALRAREDEVRHARATRALAERWGAEVSRPEVVIGAPRPLFEIALENAVEGCVRETFGALVASLQAERAGDAKVAAALAIIAEDETRHAALAWDVASWLQERLSEDERSAIEKARARAIDELRASLEIAPAAELQTVAGMPDAALARRAFDAMFGLAA